MEHDMSQNDKTISVECLGIDNVNRKLLFSNNSPGVSAVIKYVCFPLQIISGSAFITGIIYKISYIRLHPREAMLVEWIHNRFSQSAP